MPYIDSGRISLFFEEAGSGGIPVLLLHELCGSSESRRVVACYAIPAAASSRVGRRNSGSNTLVAIT